ncbi:uncharacterized protein DUF5327 [Cytobacillus horneckiae]|uniref:YwdI family protein n=1 Tax=Cytobacillus horneckiae TaxID=549687 RepID=A0A2N0ZDR0_9BACI|nr:YwdI family protein [Cytobacillus horneckiae]MBN6884983.1 YwdI family protein [Cytobacillus horneckiae]MCM3179270.1 YwdI family protein [Cytobacillus horneckiae]MEC1154492.1 YwdI family protein [Cytobacillus horneckiae]MED2937827.1 YwdI family protein [Cytobacillus horneckiae]PKG27638.1 hypothetical protein CWS20_18105 [Cytobacillus horneckiae]
MSISMETMLHKIEKELQAAKGQNDQARMRERVHAIKAICELILDQPNELSKHTMFNAVSPQPIQPQQQQVQPVQTVGQPKPMKMEDEANGDSLFDF